MCPALSFLEISDVNLLANFLNSYKFINRCRVCLLPLILVFFPRSNSTVRLCLCHQILLMFVSKTKYMAIFPDSNIVLILFLWQKSLFSFLFPSLPLSFPSSPFLSFPFYFVPFTQSQCMTPASFVYILFYLY